MRAVSNHPLAREQKRRDAKRARSTFAGVRPEQLEFFLERVEPPDPSVLERWKALKAEGWEVDALTEEWGGQVTALIGLGCRYPQAQADAA